MYTLHILVRTDAQKLSEYSDLDNPSLSELLDNFANELDEKMTAEYNAFAESVGESGGKEKKKPPKNLTPVVTLWTLKGGGVFPYPLLTLMDINPAVMSDMSNHLDNVSEMSLINSRGHSAILIRTDTLSLALFADTC